MKTIKNTNSFYVLGVKFENVQEAIEYAINERDKNGVYVGEDDELLASLRDKEYEITEVKKGERIKNAPLPFTTSTLQQEAAKTLNFSTQKTMRQKTDSFGI